MKCSKFIDGITELALGKIDPDVTEHVSVCVDCAAMLQDLRRIVDVSRLGSYSAPEQLVRRASQIPLPKAAPQLRFLRSSLTAGARRRAAESFQRVFEGDTVLVRIMYSRVGRRWHVMVSVDPQVGELMVRGKRIKMAEGSFEFESANLEDTGFELKVDQTTVSVPPGSVDLENDAV